jgi:hypothetical protein
VANERGSFIRKQLETRRVVREPADVFGSATHQTAGFIYEALVDASSDGLDKAEDQKFRRYGFQRRHLLSIQKITNEKSR